MSDFDPTLPPDYNHDRPARVPFRKLEPMAKAFIVVALVIMSFLGAGLGVLVAAAGITVARWIL